MILKFSGFFILSFLVLSIVYTVFYIGFISEKDHNKKDFLDYFIQASSLKTFIFTLVISLVSAFSFLYFFKLD